jgi:hypothetical protein
MELKWRQAWSGREYERRQAYWRRIGLRKKPPNLEKDG